MSEARIDRISNENNTGGPTLSGITTFSGQNYFVPPRGTTAERPSDCPPGSIRFNTDGAHLEYFDGLQWLELEAFNVELGVNGALGNRGLFAGGFTPSPATSFNNIDYITISTLGNAQDFGDLINARYAAAGFASAVRGCIGAGTAGPAINIEYITFSSTGNATVFGSLSAGNHSEFPAGFSNSTRGIFAGGTLTNVISYVTIASTGNTVDFGDLSVARRRCSGLSSSTRGVICGGVTPAATNVIDYVTISTTGDAVDFGDMSTTRSTQGSCSNSTRGLFAGGGSLTNIIDFISIATKGNPQDFGDLTVARVASGGVSSQTRAVFGGGYTPSVSNIIDYVTITTAGNALDFGDMTYQQDSGVGACSNGHGGL